MGSISWLKSSHLEICKPNTALDVPRSEKTYGSAVFGEDSAKNKKRRGKKVGQRLRSLRICTNFLGSQELRSRFQANVCGLDCLTCLQNNIVDTYLPSSSFPPTSSTVGLRETAHFVPFTRLGAILGRRAKSRTWRNKPNACWHNMHVFVYIYKYVHVYELLSKPLLTLNAIQHLRFPIAFSTFGVLRIWGYRSIVLYTWALTVFFMWLLLHPQCMRSCYCHCC